MDERPPVKLADIPGLGPVRRAALEAAGVTDLEKLLALSVAELGAVRGIGVWQARKIREFLKSQGLLVELELPDGQERTVMVAPRSAEEAATLSESLNTLAAQAAVEEVMTAELEKLVDAVAEVRHAEADAEPSPEATLEAAPAAATPADSNGTGSDDWQAAVSAYGAGQPDVEDVEDVEDAAGGPAAPAGVGGAPDESPAAPWSARLTQQREQLPETALTLMDAIRQAVIIPQLTRQVTRLLITAGEFRAGREADPEVQQQAAAIMERAEQVLQAAIERRTFGKNEQKDLARRLRRRRKELETLLESVGGSAGRDSE